MSRVNRKAYTDFSMELTKKTKTSHKNKILQKKIPYAAAEPMRAIIIGTLYVAGILYKQLSSSLLSTKQLVTAVRKRDRTRVAPPERVQAETARRKQ